MHGSMDGYLIRRLLETRCAQIQIISCRYPVRVANHFALIKKCLNIYFNFKDISIILNDWIDKIIIFWLSEFIYRKKSPRYKKNWWWPKFMFLCAQGLLSYHLIKVPWLHDIHRWTVNKMQHIALEDCKVQSRRLAIFSKEISTCNSCLKCYNIAIYWG